MRSCRLHPLLLSMLCIALSACGSDAEVSSAVDATGLDLYVVDSSLAQDAYANRPPSDAGSVDSQSGGWSDTQASTPDVPLVDSFVVDTAVQDTATSQPDSGPTSDSGASSDTASNGDAGNSPDTNQPQTNAKEFNQGFIGGSCASNSQCSYKDGFCATASEGFPKGMCSAPCSKFCPDQASMATTFCVTSSEVGVQSPPGMCTVRCDFGKSPTGCRPGYSCVKMKRYNDPATTMLACVPGKSNAGVTLTACQKQLIARGVGFSTLPNPKATPKGGSSPLCQINDFLSVEPTLAGVDFRASSPTGSKLKLKLKCDFAHALVDMAEELKKKGVKEVIHWGTYNCRYIGGTKTLSEHSFANAIDIAGMKMNDGSYYSVLKAWEKGATSPKTAGGQVLKWFADTMYAKHVFNVILTPEYNAAHADHFHVDLTPGSWFKQSFTSFGEAHAGCQHPEAE
ncbi:MAG TPA: hypothetical protein DCQ06_02015 [Myxococcales bacterium]|nr:hypothetical protein [Myxococcales bacterium]HAN30349.1 hypothetical protein [Myxococcales bacterium]